VRFLKSAAPVALALFLVGGVSGSALAQNATPTDIERLQNSLSDASRAVEQLQSRDSALASQLKKELDELGEDTVYLKVKLRKNEPVARTEYFDMRDKIDDIRARARREAEQASTAAPASPARTTTQARTPASSMDVPVGTELDVRLQQTMSSATALVEDRFEATTLVDLSEGNRVIIPAGSVMRGVVSSVNKAGRIDRKGSMTLAFDQVTVKGKAYPIRATVTQAIESEGVKAEAGKIGTGAGVGAIIGGILGGFKGALAGILIGGGGTIAATEGQDVELPAGTVLRVRLDSGLDLN
jgi:hypothetical protein